MGRWSSGLGGKILETLCTEFVFVLVFVSAFIFASVFVFVFVNSFVFALILVFVFQAGRDHRQGEVGKFLRHCAMTAPPMHLIVKFTAHRAHCALYNTAMF